MLVAKECANKKIEIRTSGDMLEGERNERGLDIWNGCRNDYFIIAVCRVAGGSRGFAGFSHRRRSDICGNSCGYNRSVWILDILQSLEKNG